MAKQRKVVRTLISDFDGDGVVYGFHHQTYPLGSDDLVVTLNSGNHQTEFTLGENDFDDFLCDLRSAGVSVFTAFAKATGQ